MAYHRAPLLACVAENAPSGQVLLLLLMTIDPVVRKGTATVAATAVTTTVTTTSIWRQKTRLANQQTAHTGSTGQLELH